MATFSATSSAQDSILAGVTGLDTNYAYTRTYKWYLNNALVDTTTTAPHAGSTRYAYFGLAAGTWYHLDVIIIGGDTGAQLAHLYTDCQTQAAPPSAWSWTSAETTAFNNHGAFDELTAARWNAFVDKINEVCAAAGSSWLTNYSTVAGAKASSGGALTANKFNSVKFNIGSRISTGIADVSAGSTVYGSYFITLENKLNSWIATL